MLLDDLDDELFGSELVGNSTASSATPPAAANADAEREVKLRRLGALPGVTRDWRLPGDNPFTTGCGAARSKSSVSFFFFVFFFFLFFFFVVVCFSVLVRN